MRESCMPDCAGRYAEFEVGKFGVTDSASTGSASGIKGTDLVFPGAAGDGGLGLRTCRGAVESPAVILVEALFGLLLPVFDDAGCDCAVFFRCFVEDGGEDCFRMEDDCCCFFDEGG